jgi:dethiobiotin synthetase
VSLFVTGTDTGVGKTHNVVQLLRLLRASGLRCAGMKPICCGDRSDAELLLAQSSEGLTIDQINPLWLRTPAAPLTAAKIENREISAPSLLLAFTSLRAQVDHVLVEGVGGWSVPITADYFMSDLAVALGLPVLVIAQNKLGCINHTLLTLEAIRNRGMNCVGVALNEPLAQSDIATVTNAEVLAQLCGVPILSGLSGDTTDLPPEWREVILSSGGGQLSKEWT